MRRVLCLWFPSLAIDRVLRREALSAASVERPAVTVAMQRSALRLIALSPAAREAGLSRGMSLADARAICPALSGHEHEPHADAALMKTLLRWAGRYSPFVARAPVREGAGMLCLDITGCAHLFGGEEAMLAGMTARLDRAGFRVHAAIADTRGAAIAMARWSPGPEGCSLVPPGETRGALAPLPVAALRLDDNICAGLARLGLRCIGDLVRMPRASLARRFGVETVLQIDRALGREPEPISPEPPEPLYAVRLTLPEPIGSTADVMAALDRLSERLCTRLEQRGMGARRLRLTIFRSDSTRQSAEIGLARPARDPARFRPLFEKPVDGFEAGFGIDAVRLEASAVEPMRPEQTGAQRRERPGGSDALADLIGVLCNRIGFDRVLRFLPADSHIPERAFTCAPAAYSEPAATGWPASHTAASGTRPATLFGPEPLDPLGPGRPPERFRWRGQTVQIRHAGGPERIAPEWWWDDPAWRSGMRDYWRIEDENGRRLWLFQALGAETPGGWFVTGQFF